MDWILVAILLVLSLTFFAASTKWSITYWAAEIKRRRRHPSPKGRPNSKGNSITLSGDVTGVTFENCHLLNRESSTLPGIDAEEDFDIKADGSHQHSNMMAMMAAVNDLGGARITWPKGEIKS